MYIDEINFPNEIIEAIRNNNLVVFAGAGASVDAPTSLPNFEDLANKPQNYYRVHALSIIRHMKRLSICLLILPK